MGRVPMDKVMMLIWHFRYDPDVVRFMAAFVEKVREIDLHSTRTLNFSLKDLNLNMNIRPNLYDLDMLRNKLQS